MIQGEYDKLTAILRDKPWLAHKLLTEYMKTVEVVEEVKGKRTSQQNRALHMAFSLLAESLNNSGLDMRALLKPEVNVPWTQHTVKEHLFKPFMRLMTGKESTTELTKTGGEIEQVWNTLMRELGEKHGIEFIPFPHEEMKGLRLGAFDNLQRDSYPELVDMPKF
jgi:hypothetical protein